MRTLIAVVAAICLVPAAAAAQGTNYPTKPMTIVVPAAPGGVTDALGRMLAQRFTAAWGQQAIVENKPGANNQIAADYVTKAAPDGYTLMIGPEVTFTVNPSLYPKLSYDPVKGFTPISGLVTINQALIANPSLPAQNVKELIALAKQKPGELNYGTFGGGSTGHLNMELFQAMSGTKLQALHYKGATPALTDVIAGHIQMMFISVGTAVPQWKTDKVKLIAVGSGKRMALLPEVPTVAESGLPGYEAVSWFGLFGPPGCRPTSSPRSTARCARSSPIPRPSRASSTSTISNSIAGSPEQLTNAIKADEPKWRKVIKDAKVQAE